MPRSCRGFFFGVDMKEEGFVIEDWDGIEGNYYIYNKEEETYILNNGTCAKFNTVNDYGLYFFYEYDAACTVLRNHFGRKHYKTLEDIVEDC